MAGQAACPQSSRIGPVVAFDAESGDNRATRAVWAVARMIQPEINRDLTIRAWAAVTVQADG